MGISKSELEDIAQVVEDFLPDDCVILRGEMISPETYGDGRITGEKVRATPGFGFHKDLADRFKTINAYTLTFRNEADIRVGDRVCIPNDTDEDKEVFEVRDVRDRKSYQPQIKVIADRIS